MIKHWFGKWVEKIWKVLYTYSVHHVLKFFSIALCYLEAKCLIGYHNCKFMYIPQIYCRHVLYSINFLNICLLFWCLFIFTSCVCSCSKFLICCRPRLFCVSIQLQTLFAFLSHYKHFCVDQKSILVSCVCPLFEFLNHCRPRIFSVDIWLQAFSSLHHDVLGDIGMSHCVHVFTFLFLWTKGMCGHLVTWIFYRVILSQWYPCIP